MGNRRLELRPVICRPAPFVVNRFDSRRTQGEAPRVVLTLYLAALIFGVGTFLMQALFSTHGSEGGALDLEHNLDLAHGSELGHGTDSDALTHAAADAHAEHPSNASVLLSLRFYMFAALGFGIVGAPVTWLDGSSPVMTFVVALATGLGIAALASYAFRSVGRNVTSSSVAPEELVGRVGRVLLKCGKGRRGKVRLSVQGQLVDYVATTDDAELEAGATVIVQEVFAERVHVCAAPVELLSE